jgi:hypothetical protein
MVAARALRRRFHFPLGAKKEIAILCFSLAARHTGLRRTQPFG